MRKKGEENSRAEKTNEFWVGKRSWDNRVEEGERENVEDKREGEGFVEGVGCGTFGGAADSGPVKRERRSSWLTVSQAPAADRLRDQLENI